VPAAYQPVAYDPGAPVAGRVPAAMPELPAAGPSSWNQPAQPAWGAMPPAEPAAGQPAWGTAPPAEPAAPQPAWGTMPPAEPAAIPRQRVEEDYRYPTPLPPAQPEPVAPTNGHASDGMTTTPLRRRVPGSQLPTETGTPLPTAPPSQDDAVAARAAFDAFEAGVSRAQWDVVETDMSSPPSAGHAPLARRVPGATLPRDEPNSPPPPVAAPPLDPDAARALMEQFEYGVALALNETQPQPEGQPR
jgi:hypothetical protein